MSSATGATKAVTTANVSEREKTVEMLSHASMGIALVISALILQSYLMQHNPIIHPANMPFTCCAIGYPSVIFSIAGYGWLVYKRNQREHQETIVPQATSASQIELSSGRADG